MARLVQRICALPDFPPTRSSTSTSRPFRPTRSRGSASPGSVRASSPIRWRGSRTRGAGRSSGSGAARSPGPGTTTPITPRSPQGYVSITPLQLDLTNHAAAAKPCATGGSRTDRDRRLPGVPLAAGRDTAAQGHPRHGGAARHRHRSPASASSPNRSSTRPTRTPRCRSARGRPSPSPSSRRGPANCCGSPGASGCSRSVPVRGTRPRCSSMLAETVFSIERIAELARHARTRCCAGSASTTSRILHGDGSLGWKPNAPYDGIIVAAASPAIPQPLVEQWSPGGRMVIPVGSPGRPGAHPGDPTPRGGGFDEHPDR